MSDILERVRKIVIEHLDAEPDKVTEKASFIDDLGADSLDNVELVMAFEEEFDIEIPDDAAEHIQTVGDAVKFIQERLEAPEPAASRPGRLTAARRPSGLRAAVSSLAQCGPAGTAPCAEAWARSHHRSDASPTPRRAGQRARQETDPKCAVSWSPELAWSHPRLGGREDLVGDPGRQVGRGPDQRLFDVTDYACKVACEVPRVDGRGGGGPDFSGAFDPDQVMSPREQRRVDDFILYAMAAADEAVKDANWTPEDENERKRTGVIIGSGIGGLASIAETAIELHEKGPRRVSPFFIPSALINLASGQVSIRYGFKGPNHAVVTACATGAHAVGDAARLIQFGDADVMIAGGAEAAVCPIGIAGFIACRAMSTNFNDTPERASRPYDKDRDGFVMGEGAGVLVVEELEHAKKRGAKIYAEIVGYGLAGDAYHITAPAEDGDGGYRAMEGAIGHAGIEPADIDYINAHGTSTPLGDEIELGAVERLLGQAAGKTAMSSTKSSIGHLLQPPARWRRRSRCWRCATRSLRQPSISIIPRSTPPSIWCPTRPSR